MISWAAIFQRDHGPTPDSNVTRGTAVLRGPRSPTRSSRHLLPRSPSGRPSRPFRFRTCSCPAFRKRRKIMRHGGEKWRGVIFWVGEAARRIACASSLESSRSASSVESMRPILPAGTSVRTDGYLQATPESEGTVRIIVVPHCTQRWVTSSRSLDAAPSASSAGSTAVITILCTQSGQGTSRDGRRDGLTSW